MKVALPLEESYLFKSIFNLSSCSYRQALNYLKKQCCCGWHIRLSEFLPVVIDRVVDITVQHD